MSENDSQHTKNGDSGPGPAAAAAAAAAAACAGGGSNSEQPDADGGGGDGGDEEPLGERQGPLRRNDKDAENNMEALNGLGAGEAMGSDPSASSPVIPPEGLNDKMVVESKHKRSLRPRGARRDSEASISAEPPQHHHNAPPRRPKRDRSRAPQPSAEQPPSKLLKADQAEENGVDDGDGDGDGGAVAAGESSKEGDSALVNRVNSKKVAAKAALRDYSFSEPLRRSLRGKVEIEDVSLVEDNHGGKKASKGQSSKAGGGQEGA